MSRPFYFTAPASIEVTVKGIDSFDAAHRISEILRAMEAVTQGQVRVMEYGGEDAVSPYALGLELRGQEVESSDSNCRRCGHPFHTGVCRSQPGFPDNGCNCPHGVR